MLAMLGATDASVSGTNGGVIYIDTEGAFSSERCVAFDFQPAHDNVSADAGDLFLSSGATQVGEHGTKLAA